MSTPTRVTAASAAPRRRASRLRTAGLAALAGLLVWVVAGLPFFVFPATGPLPKHADVIMVLGPDTPERVALAERLFAQGVAPAMLWSTPTTPSATSESVLQTCRTTPGLQCFVPSPSTTAGEAQELGRVARARGWRSAIVITQTPHLIRAQSIISGCFSGRLTMASSGEPPQHGWAYEYAYQTAATVKAWLHPACG